jgi:hypothetical protein
MTCKGELALLYTEMNLMGKRLKPPITVLPLYKHIVYKRNLGLCLFEASLAYFISKIPKKCENLGGFWEVYERNLDMFRRSWSKNSITSYLDISITW